MTVELASMLVTALGVAVAAVGLLFIYAQLKSQNRQRKLELGNFYIARYWEIDDAMLLALKGSDEHRRHRHRYLRLCEDEYDAARCGWLDEEQWSIWHAGLTSTKGAAALTADIAVCDPDGSNFTSMRACLAQVEHDQGTHPVRHCGPIA